MSDFYQQFVTDKSFSLLQALKGRYKFILIGGWAVYFYTRALKSKDIDVIVDFSQLAKLKKEFVLEKNDRLKKYQIKMEAIDIDVYLPYYSDLGFPVEAIGQRITMVNGFTLPEKEVLLLTKLAAYQGRKGSVKGQKDLIDVIGLAALEDFDCQYFVDLAQKYRLNKLRDLLKIMIGKTKEVEELNLNCHVFAKKKKDLLVKL
jgi:hypothetical protein